MSKTRLSAFRVIELGSLSAGAYAARLFADFGAEVIKIEPAAGDPGEPFHLWWMAQAVGLPTSISARGA